MARTGRFGRMPRQPSSLTNTLVAIAREYQNQRAQNIMDAWQKGGTFEGKKATDAVVLAFWKDKMAGVSHDDPLYDTYKNAHSQLDYTIHESKMTAAYAQHKVSDSAMVSFYLGWAKKVPKDSEFYRVLQRDAGQYMRNNKAKAAAEAARRKEQLYQTQQADTRQQMEAGGEYIIETLRRVAQSGYVNGRIAAVISAPGSGSDLTDFDPSDPATMMQLIAAIAPQGKEVNQLGFTVGTGEFKGNTDVIYYDDDKKPVTGTDIMNQLAKLDPSFKPGQPLDVKYVTQLLDRQAQGLSERIARADKTGHMTDMVSLQKSKSYVAMLNREVGAYPVQKAYQEARADYDAVVSNKQSSPAAVLKAWEEYSATLTSLAGDPRIATDDNLRSRLIAERDGTPGVPTLNESFTGLSTAQFDASSAKDAAENKVNIEFMQAQVEAVAKGEAVWTYGEKDSNGMFVPKAGGRKIGAATPAAVQAGGANMQTITIDDPLGGVPLTMMVTAVPVYATAKDPETGKPLSTTNSNPVAWAYDLPKGGTFETQYGFQTKDGFVFSSDPPWDEKLPTRASDSGGNHIEVDVTSAMVKALGYGEQDPITGAYATKPDLTTDADLPGGFHIRTSGEFDANTGLPKPGQIVFDPQDAAWSTDTRSALGSTDPMTDFTSLTMASLMASSDGRAILSNLDKHPEFKTAIANDNYSYAGYTRDMKTGAWVPGENADPAKLAKAQGQTNIMVAAKSFNDFLTEAAKGWQRLTTGSPFVGGQQGTTTGKTGPGFTAEGFAKLATDLVKGTPFEALGNIFHPGTATIKPAELSAQTGFTIKPATVIKAPAIPDVKPITIPGATVGTTSAPQIGSTAPTAAAPTQVGSAPPPVYRGGARRPS